MRRRTVDAVPIFIGFPVVWLPLVLMSLSYAILVVEGCLRDHARDGHGNHPA